MVPSYCDYIPDIEQEHRPSKARREMEQALHSFLFYDKSKSQNPLQKKLLGLPGVETANLVNLLCRCRVWNLDLGSG